MTINIKPHHLLDVFKLYGQGIFPFTPDINFEHDFYLIGNLIINRKVDSVTFTTQSDDICKPCLYNENGSCTDELNHGGCISKNDYNQFIDRKLLDYFLLNENNEYKLDAVLVIFSEKATIELFCKVWDSNQIHSNEIRFLNTVSGIKKYMS